MSSFSEEIDREITEHISAIESPGYQYPTRFTRADWLGMALVTAICLAGSLGVIIYYANL